MRVSLFAAGIIMALLLPISASFAAIFFWTDRAGNTHVSDDISKVPAEYQGQAKARQMQDDDADGQAQKGRNEERAPAPGYKKKAEKRAQSGTGDTDSSGRGEEYWRERADGLRQQLHELQDDYESVSRHERECEKKPIDHRGKRIDCASIFGYHRERLEKQINQTRKALEVDLPDDARKAGAYPGWIR